MLVQIRSMHINMDFETGQNNNAGLVRANSWFTPSRWTDRMRRKDSNAPSTDILPSPEELRASGIAPDISAGGSSSSNPKNDLSTGGVPLADFKPSKNPAIV